MNAYMSIAIVVFLLAAFVPTKTVPVNSTIGSIMLGLIWPVTLVLLAYLLIKKYVFRSLGLSKNILIAEAEILGALATTCVLMILVLYVQNNPFVVNLVKGLFGSLC